VAGIGTMTYMRFLVYNVVGGLLWVVVCVGAGYLFGGLPIVQDNFSLVVLAIIAISLMPAVVEYLRYRASPPVQAIPAGEEAAARSPTDNINT
jgi:membrane-associated protein